MHQESTDSHDTDPPRGAKTIPSLPPSPDSSTPPPPEVAIPPLLTPPELEMDTVPSDLPIPERDGS